MQILCATFYLSDGESPGGTKIVLEIWDVFSKPKGNCYHSNGTQPKLQLLAVLLHSESVQNLTVRFFSAANLPLHCMKWKKEHSQIQTEKCYFLPTQNFHIGRYGAGLCQAPFQSCSSRKQLYPPALLCAMTSGPLDFERCCRAGCVKMYPRCITAWHISVGKGYVHFTPSTKEFLPRTRDFCMLLLKMRLVPAHFVGFRRASQTQICVYRNPSPLQHFQSCGQSF